MTTMEALLNAGLPLTEAETFLQTLTKIQQNASPETQWQIISKSLLKPHHPFSLHLYLFSTLYPNWQDNPGTAPAWIPEFVSLTNLGKLLNEKNLTSVHSFHQWSVDNREAFWDLMIKKLGIVFQKPYSKVGDYSKGLEQPTWLPDARMNIVDSCFTAPPTANAIIYLDKNNNLQRFTYDALNRLMNRVANSLVAHHFKPGDRIAIAMPMTVEAVAIYLGIIKMGGVVVSIADSFSSEEIATRLRIANAKAIFTEDFVIRGGKKLFLYDKVAQATPQQIIVLTHEESACANLRAEDVTWNKFLSAEENFNSYLVDAMNECNILFSSGTTGDPKAIPWLHNTPIKSASDAYLHQNIKPGDVLCWPTNLGWMMGPWLIFAGLINKATLALYTDIPTERAFGEFIQNARVTMLGVVPTLVANWKQKQCMQGLDWHAINVFSSTGECSNPEDMLYLMSLANYKPIIEYCGGTETGGSYITSTVLENNYPTVFTTPAMGTDFVLLDDEQNIADEGEVAFVPPILGLSTYLLNADHHQIYFANMPSLSKGTPLRRHGDQATRVANGFYCILGRVDDTMNLSGIKISSAEIERVIAGLPDIIETAAIAVSPPHNGPSQLVIYASTLTELNADTIKKEMQTRINQHLNPLFKIHQVVFMPELPKTASNKIMRRILRKQYEAALS